jgi:hypothetical protein
MDLRKIIDWTHLTGASIEIHQQGSHICSGQVDAVTEDGKILWVRPPAQTRRLFEKAELYEAWTADKCSVFTTRKGLFGDDEQSALQLESVVRL